jgi:hypothetical protein
MMQLDEPKCSQRRSIAFLLVGSGCVALALASPLGSVIGVGSNQALQVDAPVAVPRQEAQAIDPESVQRTTPPILSVAMRGKAESLLRANQLVAQATNGGRFNIVSSGPLTVPSASGGSDVVIGAAFEVRTTAPVALLDQALPTAQPDPRGLDIPPYQAYSAHYTASRVTGYTVLVDTTRSTVIAVTPLPGADVSNVSLPAGFVPKYGIRTESGSDITSAALAAHDAVRTGADPQPAVSRANAQALEVTP